MIWLLMACGDKADSGSLSPCLQEDRAVEAVLDTAFSGQTTTLTVTDMAPAFPAVDDNLWELSLQDSSGALTGCTLSGTIDMPDHGHGGAAPTFTELGEGRYEMAARFTMGGYWEVGLDIQCAEADTVVLNLCVEG